MAKEDRVFDVRSQVVAANSSTVCVARLRTRGAGLIAEREAEAVLTSGDVELLLRVSRTTAERVTPWP